MTFVKGTDFGGDPQSLRLAYSFVSPAEIAGDGAARLAAAIPVTAQRAPSAAADRPSVCAGGAGAAASSTPSTTPATSESRITQISDTLVDVNTELHGYAPCVQDDEEQGDRPRRAPIAMS